MHSMGLHSALAIKRQRKRRDEQRRARERRYSTQSTESGMGESQSSFVSPRSSVRGRHRRPHSSGAPDALVDNKIMSSVGMLHIGVVFLVVGGFLLASGLLPEDLTSWSTFTTSKWWNELTVAGGCAILLGIFLIVLNSWVSKREEDDLTEYVQRQLTRSRSGHRLVRDVETGALTNKHRAARTGGVGGESSHDLGAGSTGGVLIGADLGGAGGGVGGGVGGVGAAFVSPMQSPTLRSPPHSSSPPHHLHCDLEQIIEEEASEKGEEDARAIERFNKDLIMYSPNSPAGGFSPGSGPGTPSETRELLHHQHSASSTSSSHHHRHHSHHGQQHSHHHSSHHMVAI